MATTIYNDPVLNFSFYGNSTYGNFDITASITNWFKCTNSFDSFQTFLSNTTEFSYDNSLNLQASFKPQNFAESITLNINHTSQTASIGVGDFLLAEINVDPLLNITQFTSTKTSNSFSFFNISYSSDYLVNNTFFLSAAKIQNINTNASGYYSADARSHYAIIAANNTQTFVYHFLQGTQKQANQDYDFAIVCQNSQAPFSKWLTTFLLFDANEDLGDPCIGVYPDLILGTGTFEIGQLIKVANGSEQPTSSINPHYYIPTCKLSPNRTILQRIWKL